MFKSLPLEYDEDVYQYFLDSHFYLKWILQRFKIITSLQESKRNSSLQRRKKSKREREKSVAVGSGNRTLNATRFLAAERRHCHNLTSPSRLTFGLLSIYLCIQCNGMAMPNFNAPFDSLLPSSSSSHLQVSVPRLLFIHTATTPNSPFLTTLNQHTLTIKPPLQNGSPSLLWQTRRQERPLDSRRRHRFSLLHSRTWPRQLEGCACQYW